MVLNTRVATDVAVELKPAVAVELAITAVAVEIQMALQTVVAEVDRVI
jgi:hypothetical protein